MAEGVSDVGWGDPLVSLDAPDGQTQGRSGELSVCAHTVKFVREQ